LQRLEQEIAALRPQVEEVDRIRKESQVLEGKIKYVEQMFCATDHNLELLTEMTTTIPDDTYLLYLSNREGDIMFQGLSQSASSLLPLLSKSKYLRGVEPQAPFTRDPVSGKERFSLKARVEEALPCN
jgi:general secretion pathway protein L